SFLFLFTDTSASEIYTLSLHDALPISIGIAAGVIEMEVGVDHPPDIGRAVAEFRERVFELSASAFSLVRHPVDVFELVAFLVARSEEHTSELQSLRHLVCRLLLEKKNK